MAKDNGGVFLSALLGSVVGGLLVLMVDDKQKAKLKRKFMGVVEKGEELRDDVVENAEDVKNRATRKLASGLKRAGDKLEQ